jgi:predicted metal-dependent HD superfamily phosphohydrolase
LHNPIPGTFITHNLAHTQSVVANVNRIALHYQLNDQDCFIVIMSAWFHDIGYLKDCKDHEVAGAEKAAAFLREQGADESLIMAINGCILSTKMPQDPKNLLEQVVCDADLFHFGQEIFSERNKLMRKEAEIRSGHKIPKDDWRASTIRLLESHHYHTDFCKEILEPPKTTEPGTPQNQS